jgi:predicted nucleic acid-binding protein
MELVIDANILFSALIRDSFTYELLFREDLKLYAPDFLMKEFKKYEPMILRKTCRTRENFIEILHIMNEVITTVPKHEYSAFIKNAVLISPDEKDVMYFASALRLGCGIWSNDKKLKEQSDVPVYSTEDIIREF